MPEAKKLKLIGCETMFREFCATVARSPFQIDVEFLPKGLHDLGGRRMKGSLQEALDRAEGQGYDAVLLGYALCGNGIAGLETRSIPLIVPRAHDCIALLMGGRKRYQDYFDRNPGCYYRSTGWLERGKGLQQLESGATNPGAEVDFDTLVEKYGEENASYLYEELTRYRQHYRKLTYIQTGLEPDGHFEQQAREEASQRGWEFERVEGGLALFEHLMNGDWDTEDFLTVPPRHRIAVTYDDNIIRAEPVEDH